MLRQGPLYVIVHACLCFITTVRVFLQIQFASIPNDPKNQWIFTKAQAASPIQMTGEFHSTRAPTPVFATGVGVSGDIERPNAPFFHTQVPPSTTTHDEQCYAQYHQVEHNRTGQSF